LAGTDSSKQLCNLPDYTLEEENVQEIKKGIRGVLSTVSESKEGV